MKDAYLLPGSENLAVSSAIKAARTLAHFASPRSWLG